MKWITRSHVHVDRVACPWLITRFIDSDAEFLIKIGQTRCPDF
ncbi:MAG: chromate resistance protein ChrB domain-containing protein [Desulfobacteraceae bacterium]|nr:chromate resistance protein ChrB domain-containing protein [Desulfobacteraceae bacterium]